MKVVRAVLQDGTVLEVEARSVSISDKIDPKYVWVRFLGPDFLDKKYCYADGLGDLEVGEVVVAGISGGHAVVIGPGSKASYRHFAPDITKRVDPSVYRGSYIGHS